MIRTHRFLATLLVVLAACTAEVDPRAGAGDDDKEEGEEQAQVKEPLIDELQATDRAQRRTTCACTYQAEGYGTVEQCNVAVGLTDFFWACERDALLLESDLGTLECYRNAVVALETCLPSCQEGTSDELVREAWACQGAYDDALIACPDHSHEASCALAECDGFSLPAECVPTA